MVSRRTLRLAGLLLAFVAGAARASVGLLELPAHDDTPQVTVFYPSAEPAANVQRGPFSLQLAARAAPVRGNGRLVVISHGTGGAAWTYADLAMRLVDAGFVVAVPLHRGDNYADQSASGLAAFKSRPVEISRTIDAVAAQPALAALLSLDRVGMYGMSAGGHTALTLAGGRWSPSLLQKHCVAHRDEDAVACTPLAQLVGVPLDDATRAALRRSTEDETRYAYTDPRVQAIVAEVPFAADFEPATLAHPAMPVGLVRAGRDAWLRPAFHVDAVRQACSTCELVAHVPSAGHGSLMSPQVPDLPPKLAALLGDPPGFDRALVPPVHERIVAFFRAHLLP